MASTVETLELIILPPRICFFLAYRIVRDSLLVMEATYVKQLAMTEVTPPKIPLRKLARQSQEGSMLSILKIPELIYSNFYGTFHLPDKAEVNNASQHTTYRWKIHWHLPKKKSIFDCSREYIQLHLPNRSLHPPMKQSTRMLGMLAEMVEILIHPLVSTLMWFTASLAS